MTIDTHRAIEAVWHIESAKVIAGVARMLRDVGLAEELAQDALVAALETWPTSGVPMPPREFGEKVVSVLDDPQYAEGLAFGLKGDTGITMLEGATA